LTASIRDLVYETPSNHKPLVSSFDTKYIENLCLNIRKNSAQIYKKLTQLLQKVAISEQKQAACQKEIILNQALLLNRKVSL
jgi:hypothetical protein